MRIRAKYVLFAFIAGGVAVVAKQKLAAAPAPQASDPFMTPSKPTPKAAEPIPKAAESAPSSSAADAASGSVRPPDTTVTEVPDDDEDVTPLPDPPKGPFTTAPDGPADDLKRISGVGPKLEAMLNDQGITTFAQLAELDDEGVDALQERLTQFPGRIRRDDWVEQAKRLAAEG